MFTLFFQGKLASYPEIIQSLSTVNSSIEVTDFRPELIQEELVYFQQDEKETEITMKIKFENYAFFQFLHFIYSNLKTSDIPHRQKNIIFKTPCYDEILNMLFKVYNFLSKEEVIRLFVIETTNSIFGKYHVLAHQIDYDEKFDKECKMFKLRIKSDDNEKLLFFVSWIEIIKILTNFKKIKN
jgi:hypothetical protein